MSSEAVVTNFVGEAGLDMVALRARADEPAARERLREATSDALARGAFGAPTFFVGDDMFFGQDRLDFVEEALADRARR